MEKRLYISKQQRNKLRQVINSESKTIVNITRVCELNQETIDEVIDCLMEQTDRVLNKDYITCTEIHFINPYGKLLDEAIIVQNRMLNRAS